VAARPAPGRHEHDARPAQVADHAPGAVFDHRAHGHVHVLVIGTLAVAVLVVAPLAGGRPQLGGHVPQPGHVLGRPEHDVATVTAVAAVRASVLVAEQLHERHATVAAPTAGRADRLHVHQMLGRRPVRFFLDAPQRRGHRHVVSRRGIQSVVLLVPKQLELVTELVLLVLLRVLPAMKQLRVTAAHERGGRLATDPGRRRPHRDRYRYDDDRFLLKSHEHQFGDQTRVFSLALTALVDASGRRGNLNNIIISCMDMMSIKMALFLISFVLFLGFYDVCDRFKRHFSAIFKTTAT